MAWSKNPLAYPKIFHDILDAAMEGRERFTIKTAPGRAAKYRFQFYGYRNAWLEKAKESRKIGDFRLAGEEEAKAAKLARYQPIPSVDSVTFINKEVVLMEENVTLEISEKRITDDAYEMIDLATQHRALQEEQRAIRKLPKKEQPKRIAEPTPAGRIVDGQTRAALEKHGLIADSTELKRDNIIPVPTDPEELRILAQLNEERNAPPDKEWDEK